MSHRFWSIRLIQSVQRWLNDPREFGGPNWLQTTLARTRPDQNKVLSQVLRTSRRTGSAAKIQAYERINRENWVNGNNSKNQSSSETLDENGYETGGEGDSQLPVRRPVRPLKVPDFVLNRFLTECSGSEGIHTFFGLRDTLKSLLHELLEPVNQLGVLTLDRAESAGSAGERWASV